MRMEKSNFWGFLCVTTIGITVFKMIDRILLHRERLKSGKKDEED